MKKIIFTEKAPKPVGPYSQAVEVNGILFISGQVPLDPDTSELVEGGIKEQTMQVLKNVESILEVAGYSMADIVKTTCLLADMKDFREMNGIYSRFFSDNSPARAAFAVKELPLGALIEIEAVAMRR